MPPFSYTKDPTKIVARIDNKIINFANVAFVEDYVNTPTAKAVTIHFTSGESIIVADFTTESLWDYLYNEEQ